MNWIAEISKSHSSVYIQNGWLEVDTLEDKQRYEVMNISHADLFDFRVVCQTD
jgi:hypothetical protein